jgi:organic hydroperoxide reductase OsmC/OhrA
MHPYPHTYVVCARGGATGSVEVSSTGLHPIQTSPPPQFDGPPGVWSPETLLCAAIADCLILTFRGMSRAARFEWRTLDCRVEGVLERVDGI